mgnify:CR=1 FL=1|tara:strand:+ start:1242 stop:2114 length:873 start_codon:yes stop_codon:yes gene_type:complete
MKNASLSYEQNFYVNGTGLSGVQAINGSYGIQERPINVVGYGYVNHIIDSPIEGNFTIDRILINEDGLMNFTGDGAAFSGVVSYNTYGTFCQTGSFGFHSGYLTSYSLSCDVGNLPEVSTNIVVYGDIGSGIQFDTLLGDKDPSEDNTINAPNQGSIGITCDEINTSSNRIVSFNHEVSCQREPIYALPRSATDFERAKYPVQVDLVYPLEQTTNLTMEIDDYETKNLYQYLTGAHSGQVNIDISGSNHDSAIASFHLDDARLVNESFSSSVGGVATVSMTFKKYINKRR